VANEPLKSNLTLRILSSLFLVGITIVSLSHGSPLFEALLFIAFLFLMYELKQLPFKGNADALRQGSFFVALYLVISFLSVYWLFDTNPDLVFWLFCIVWSSDIGGYCAGKFFGGPKVLPKVSPNKTWAGVLGACFLTFFVIALFIENTFAGLDIPSTYHRGLNSWLWLDTNSSLGWRETWTNLSSTAELLVLSLIFSLLSQIGDFLESYIKRRLGIKDTGSLIPGHGGLFDRLDGLIFVAPIFALFIYSL